MFVVLYSTWSCGVDGGSTSLVSYNFGGTDEDPGRKPNGLNGGFVLEVAIDVTPVCSSMTDCHCTIEV